MASSVSLSASASSCRRASCSSWSGMCAAEAAEAWEFLRQSSSSPSLSRDSILALASSPVMKGSCEAVASPSTSFASRLTMSAASASAPPRTNSAAASSIADFVSSRSSSHFGSAGNFAIAGWCAACASTSQRCVTAPARADSTRTCVATKPAQPRTLKSSTGEPFVVSSFVFSPAPGTISPHVRSTPVSSLTAVTSAEAGTLDAPRSAERSTPARAAASPGAANTESAPRVKDPWRSISTDSSALPAAPRPLTTAGQASAPPDASSPPTTPSTTAAAASGVVGLPRARFS
mmetsp:Transcript_13220/g.51772  ORF Transcript_13220/g.51772 Transcript_13220/m.51772 type:complete len:291 (+) Transcript_13220:1643-2515(+)